MPGYLISQFGFTGSKVFRAKAGQGIEGARAKPGQSATMCLCMASYLKSGQVYRQQDIQGKIWLGEFEGARAKPGQGS